jgi:hypothetical protein
LNLNNEVIENPSGFVAIIIQAAMTRGKTMNVTDETALRDVHGMGSQSFTVLGVAGYNLRPTSTVGDFKRQTGSFAELRDTLSKGDMNYKYVLPKYQSMWSTNNPIGEGDRNNKRKAPEPDTMSREEELKANRTDSEVNFLLAPQKGGGPDTSQYPEIVTNSEETPEVDSLDRQPRDQATAVGDIAPKVQAFVVPDQTQIISPDDKEINAPILVLPEDPVPVTPAIAIGESVFASRLIAPLTREEKLDEDLMGEELPSVKANGTKDIGGDGTGSLSYQAVIGNKTQSNPDDQQAPSAPSGGGGGAKFTSVPLSTASTPTFDAEQPIKAQDPRTASRHPFKQPGLFRDHDMAATMAVAIESSTYNTRKLREAANEALSHRDESWYRWNPATQGVAMVDMPETASNYLQRGQMVSEYQLLGVNDLQLAYSPSPFTAHALLGGFGGMAPIKKM